MTNSTYLIRVSYNRIADLNLKPPTPDFSLSEVEGALERLATSVASAQKLLLEYKQRLGEVIIMELKPSSVILGKDIASDMIRQINSKIREAQENGAIDVHINIDQEIWERISAQVSQIDTAQAFLITIWGKAENKMPVVHSIISVPNLTKGSK
jgi:hypothetical protein